MSAAPGLPEVVPEFAAVARVHRPRVVRHCEIESAIHFEHGGLDGASATGDVAGALAPDNDISSAAAAAAPSTEAARITGARGHAAHPGQREVLDVRLIHLLE